MTQQDEMIQALTQRACAAEARAAKLEARNASLAAHAGDLGLRIDELDVDLADAHAHASAIDAVRILAASERDQLRRDMIRFKARIEELEAQLEAIDEALGVTAAHKTVTQENSLDAIEHLQRDLANARAAESALHSLRERVRGLARYMDESDVPEAAYVARELFSLLDEPASEKPKVPPFTWTADDRAKLVTGARVTWHHPVRREAMPQEFTVVCLDGVDTIIATDGLPAGLRFCDPTTIIPPEPKAEPADPWAGDLLAGARVGDRVRVEWHLTNASTRAPVTELEHVIELSVDGVTPTIGERGFYVRMDDGTPQWRVVEILSRAESDDAEPSVYDAQGVV